MATAATKQKAKKPQTVSDKKYLIFVGGEKGGAGKTQTTKALTHVLQEKGVDFYPVECDRSNPDLYKACKEEGCQMTYFSENEKKQNKADKLYDLVQGKTLLVSLPAQVYNPLKSWLERGMVIDKLKEFDIDVLMLFVCTGSPISVDLFIKSLTEMGEEIPHVLVKNLRMREDWDKIDNNLAELKEKIPFKTLELPIIDYDEQDIIEGENKDKKFLSFSDAINLDYLGSMQKNRVKAAMQNLRKGFDKLGYL